MATYKKNPILTFFRIFWELLKFTSAFIVSLVFVFIAGLFFIGLMFRDFLIAKFMNIKKKP